jgi:hypothetical protein
LDKPKIKKDLTGKRFGKLVVIGLSRRENHRNYWSCVCDCNPDKIIERTSDTFRVSKMSSCGCITNRRFCKSKNKFEINDEYGIGYYKDFIFYFDIEDYDFIKEHSWCVNGAGYLMTCILYKMVLMHRIIKNCPRDKMVDHIDGNTLNNRKNNLRIVTDRENMQNIKKEKVGKSSKYYGVSYQKKYKKFRVLIQGLDGNRILIGYYDSEIEAAKAFNLKAQELGYLTYNKIDGEE